MKHEERIAIGTEYANNLLKKLGDELVLFGIGGSTYRNEDREDSDLDVIIVTEHEGYGGASKWHHELVKDLLIEMEYFHKAEIEKILKTPGWNWPQNLFRLTNFMPVYQKYDFKKWCKELVDSVEDEKFIDAAIENINIANSSMGKVREHYRKRNLSFLRSAALLTVSYLDLALALVNRGVLYPGFGARDVALLISQYKKLPEGYVSNALKLWESCDIDEIYNAAEILTESTKQFVKQMKKSI